MRFEPHQKKRESKLTKFIDEISEMRIQQWPYSRVRDYLFTKHKISISLEAVRQFCISRSIKKGEGLVSTPINPTPNETSKIGTQPKIPTTSDDDEIYNLLTSDESNDTEDKNKNPFSPKL